MKEAAASPLVIGVNEQLRRLGTRKHIEVQAEVPGLALSSARVPEGAEVAVDVMIEAISHASVTATGEVTAPWEGECRRCLAIVEGTLTADVKEVFEAHPVEGETYPLEHDEVDLEPLARETVVLELPQAPLCREDCQGLCPECGADRNEGTCSCAPPIDPRWAVLDELRNADREES
jgi:uncharacterized protein